MAVAAKTVALEAGAAWVCLNAASAAAGDFTLQPQFGWLWLKTGADGTTVPTTFDGALRITPDQAIVGRTIAKVFAGSAHTYLWARAEGPCKAAFASA